MKLLFQTTRASGARPSPACLGLALLLASAAASAQPDALLRSGEQVYLQTCVACHGAGVAGAPRFGDRKTWRPLIAEGQPVLTSHAWVGVRGMPAKGGRDDLTLEEFARAVAYMAREAGAHWQDPDARMLDRMEAEAKKRRAALARRSRPD